MFSVLPVGVFQLATLPLGEAGSAAAVLAAVVFFALAALQPESYRRRFVPNASPAQLGAIRALSGAVLLAYWWAGDLSRTARLPRELLVSSGVIDGLHVIPGFGSFLTAETALAWFSTATGLALLLAAAGLWTRWTAPAAAVLAVVYFGIFRHYTYFYHQGLFALYVFAAAALGPSGDGFSLDAWLRRRRGERPVEPNAAHAWGRYLCWTVLALPYWLAGCSKLRIGGFSWWEAHNLRAKMHRDAVQGGVFDQPLAGEFLDAPDVLFAGLGFGTLVLELSFLAVLISPLARRILPLGAVGLHLGILAFQNFIFIDGLLMQAIFYDRSRRLVAQPSTLGGGRAGGAATAAAGIYLCLGWLFRVEAYPVTSWAMYARLRDAGETAVYYRAHALTGAGDSAPAPYNQCFPVPVFNAFIRMPRYVLSENDRARTMGESFFRACAAELNRRAEERPEIESFRIEQWELDPREGFRRPGRRTRERTISAVRPATNDEAAPREEHGLR